MHIYGLANHPLAQFLDGADAYVSCEIEKRDGLADRFASLDEYPVRSAEQRRHEGALWAALTLLNPEVHEALLKRAAEEDAEAEAAIARAESEADEDEPAPKKKARRINPRRLRPNDDLPTITLTDADRKEAVDRSEAALIKADLGVYQRDGSIVSVTVSKGISHSGKAVTYQSIAIRGDYALIEDFSRAAHYQKWDSRVGDGGDYVQVTPPLWVVMTLRQRSEKHLYPLEGIVSAPTMRADGSILSEPGYDKQSGLLFNPRGVEFPPVPDTPTLAQARAALSVLAAPIKKFPFVSDVDRSVALSGVITATVRRSLETSPLHAYRAPVAGSGKSKLVEYASVIATGEITPVIAQGPNDEETEKRLASCIIEGRSIVAIDNCTRPLADIDLLCQMLTANKVSPRILGVSKTPTLTAGALVTATGNGLRIVGDLVRRTILCDIDPGCEEPEGREFDFDPIQVAKSKRAELVIAALTILRAFHVAERPAPEGVSPLGSFEDWSLLVRNALIWLGCADPVASQRNLRKDDPMKARLEDVMAQWWDTFGNDNVIAADVIQSACERESSGYGNGKFIRPLLRDALLAVAGRGGSVNSRALGEWLSGNKGRIADGRCFEIDEKKQNGVAVWRLVEKDTR